MTNPALVAHIAGGGVGLVTGAIALTVRKGENPHRAFGKVFAVAMLIMAAMASYLAVTVPGQIGNLFGGAFTFYLIATAWMTVRRKERTVGWFEVIAFLVALAAATGLLFISVMVATSAFKLQTGVPSIAIYIMTAVAATAATLDFAMLLRRGVSGAQRVARHLWRMCVGLFVATGSFFIGKQMDMPAFMRGSPILLVLAFAPIVLMIFWLFYVALTRRFKSVAMAA